MCCRSLVFRLACLGVLNLAALHAAETTKGRTGEHVFVPSEEWQEIGEDEALPAGLHIRIDLQSGKKQAKLLSPTDENDSKFGLVLRQGDQADDLVDMYDANNSSRLESAVMTESGKDEGNRLNGEKGDRMAQLSSALDTGSVESKLSVLQELEEETHDYKKATIFMNAGGIEKLLALANQSDANLQWNALNVLGSTAQSHPMVQEKATRNGGVPLCLSLLHSTAHGTDGSVAGKAFFALSSLVRHNHLGVDVLHEHQGMAEIERFMLAQPLAGPLRMKVLLLISDLTMEAAEQLDEDHAGQPLCHLMPAQKRLVDSSWCIAAIDQLKVAYSLDSYDKALEVMSALLPGCWQTNEMDDEALTLLTTLREDWIKQSNLESDSQWKEFLLGRCQQATDIIERPMICSEPRHHDL